jgi:epoxyqueuosine reductase
MTTGHYRAWLAAGYHGEMGYLARPDAVAKRDALDRVLSGVRCVLTVGINYHTMRLPPKLRDDPSRGIIASYAWGEDYHNVLVPRLRQLAEFVESKLGEPVVSRAYVDTGPVLERELAARAGLGFVGKNTNLIDPRLGSWLFLGELLLAVDIGPPGAVRAVLARDVHNDSSHGLAQLLERGTCGRCTRCLDACPTEAFVAPYLLDARRCISYLTIELKGPIPRHLRPLMGNRIFGCDICQEVCPWNRRFAQPTAEPAFQPRQGSIAPPLLELIGLDKACRGTAHDFGQRFRNSPVERAKRRGLLRNAAVALGNWGDPTAVPALARALHDPEPLIRGHAAWALGRIGTQPGRDALLESQFSEKDTWVREEVAQALQASA